MALNFNPIGLRSSGAAGFPRVALWSTTEHPLRSARAHCVDRAQTKGPGGELVLANQTRFDPNDADASRTKDGCILVDLTQLLRDTALRLHATPSWC